MHRSRFFFEDLLLHVPSSTLGHIDRFKYTVLRSTYMDTGHNKKKIISAYVNLEQYNTAKKHEEIYMCVCERACICFNIMHAECLNVWMCLKNNSQVSYITNTEELARAWTHSKEKHNIQHWENISLWLTINTLIFQTTFQILTYDN